MVLIWLLRKKEGGYLFVEAFTVFNQMQDKYDRYVILLME